MIANEQKYTNKNYETSCIGGNFDIRSANIHPSFLQKTVQFFPRHSNQKTLYLQEYIFDQ